MERQNLANCRESEENFVKRSNVTVSRIKTLTRARKEEIETVKAALRAQLPALTSTGVRRHRVNYNESVLLELEENGFKESADFMRMLYAKDDELQNFDCKKLSKQRHLIERIKIGLMNAELARKENKIIEQTIALLDTAMFFQSLTSEWFWIADRFFKSALITSSRIDEDDGEIFNIIKYIYGKFAFNEMKELRGAITLLEEAREASKGRRWNASRVLKTQQGNLFKEINSVLHETLITLTKKSLEKNIKTAVKAAVRALECAKDTGNEEFIAQGLFEVGRAKMRSENVAEAIKSFSRYLAIVKRIPDPNGMCDGHRELAFAYKAIKDIRGVEKHLNMFKELAEKSGLMERLAEAHYCLGEFILEQGDDMISDLSSMITSLLNLPPIFQDKPSSATSHLTSSFDLYKSLGMRKEMDKARFLAGISKGEELKIEYLELLRKCEEDDPEALRKLLEWKNRRIPFYE